MYLCISSNYLLDNAFFLRSSSFFQLLYLPSFINPELLCSICLSSSLNPIFLSSSVPCIYTMSSVMDCKFVFSSITILC